MEGFRANERYGKVEKNIFTKLLEGLASSQFLAGG